MTKKVTKRKSVAVARAGSSPTTDGSGEVVLYKAGGKVQLEVAAPCASFFLV